MEPAGWLFPSPLERRRQRTFHVLARDRIVIYADAGTYPIARYGVERAAAKGVPTWMLPVHDAAALASLLQRDRATRRRPVVVTDGLCTATGRAAPLADYLKLVRERNGYLVVEDTQALGILGANPASDAPYGRRRADYRERGRARMDSGPAQFLELRDHIGAA